MGAGRHVGIEWEAGDGFEETIMWTPEEAMKSKSFSDSHADLIRYHCQSDAFMYECAGQGVAFLTGRAIDLSVLAYLLQHGTPIDVIETVVIKPSNGHHQSHYQARGQASVNTKTGGATCTDTRNGLKTGG